ncbi:alpha/beta hydrolase [Lentilactobacillus raoultii]|uniref:Alpha/beta hydrolase n=1 Tax=Lentilactobacillus raoultii TaxID=1987503 RepID=A0ABW3PCT2_9LACO|nr:alpha/beta hydrolase [Lentilactobacillus raoultii]
MKLVLITGTTLVLLISLTLLIRWVVALGRPIKRQGRLATEIGAVTLFLPGYFGSRFSFGPLLKRLVKNYQADKSLVIIVKRTGRLKLIGELAAKRSVVQILFEDKTSKPRQQAVWLDQICQLLKNQYQIDHLNLVGHSMGCITIFWYLTHQQQHAAVTIDRVVAIAGPFNDSEIARNTAIVDSVPLTAAGPLKKRPIYSALAANIATLPASIQVLNIAGRISDQQKDDGQVSVNSAFSLRYLLNRSLRRYHELIVRGRRASHRLLHENRLVDKSIAKFLWTQ